MSTTEDRIIERMEGRLVGGDPQAANQPTNDAPDMGNDMLVVLTPDGKVAIGDPSPTGTVIGQFVPVDGDYGVVEWAYEYDLVRLREQNRKYESIAGSAVATIGHLLRTVRGQTAIMADALDDDEATSFHAFDTIVKIISGDPCEICDGALPDENPVAHLMWLVRLENMKLRMTSMINRLHDEATDEQKDNGNHA